MKWLAVTGWRRLKSFWADRSLATKFVSVYFLVGLLIVVALTWRSGSQLATALEEEMEHELEIEAFIIAGTLGKDFEDMLEYGRSPSQILTLIHQFGEGTDSRITFYDVQLNLVFSTDPNVRPHRASLTPELAAALRNSEQHDIRMDPWTQEMRLYVAAPVYQEEDLMGLLQISIPWQRVQDRINSEWGRLIVTGLLAILANTLLSLWLAWSIVRPLQQVTQAARAIAGGHLDRRVPVPGKDEVGMLAVAFNEMAERLQEMIARERLFIANASHELRSPLTSLKLRAEMLREGRLPPERQRRYIMELEKEAERLHALANRLLDLSRLQLRPETEVLEAVDVMPIARDVVETLSLRAGRKDVQLRLHAPQQLPKVRASADGLREILVNLIDNAIKHTPAGGSVDVVLTPEPPYLRMEVKDTGRGIPPEDLPHIFEPFYRVDKARRRQDGGSGLGLTIVKRLVDLFHGRIEVYSSPGEGTVFVVRIPFESASATS